MKDTTPKKLVAGFKLGKTRTAKVDDATKRQPTQHIPLLQASSDALLGRIHTRNVVLPSSLPITAIKSQWWTTRYSGPPVTAAGGTAGSPPAQVCQSRPEAGVPQMTANSPALRRVRTAPRPLIPSRSNEALRPRAPRRKAVVVGINYRFSPEISLEGCCNDAAVVSLLLVNLLEFRPSDIILLIDTFPSDCYRRRDGGEEDGVAEALVTRKDRQPTRRNILLALNWLVADSLPGDVLFFYFAGHGVQLDDMSGWEGEGYDEAILPLDFPGCAEINAITAIMMRNVLLNVQTDVQVTAVIDCNGCQTMLDPAGTGTWKFIKGVKQKGAWPFVTDPTNKVARATYDPSAWTDKVMAKRECRPRFVPGVPVSSTHDLLDPTLQKPVPNQSFTKVKGFLFAAAPWSESAIEAKMPPICLKLIKGPKGGSSVTVTPTKQRSSVHHGVFTWCFVTAMQELFTKAALLTKSRRVKFESAIAEIQSQVDRLRDGSLSKLTQRPQLTFYRAGASSIDDCFLWPFGGRCRNVPFSNLKSKAEKLPLIPSEHSYLSPWQADEQLRRLGELQRQADLTLRLLQQCRTNNTRPPTEQQPVVFKEPTSSFERLEIPIEISRSLPATLAPALVDSARHRTHAPSTPQKFTASATLPGLATPSTAAPLQENDEDGDASVRFFSSARGGGGDPRKAPPLRLPFRCATFATTRAGSPPAPPQTSVPEPVASLTRKTAITRELSAPAMPKGSNEKRRLRTGFVRMPAAGSHGLALKPLIFE